MTLAAGDKAPSFKIKTDDGGHDFLGRASRARPMSCTFIPRTTLPVAPRRPSAFRKACKAFGKLGIPVIGVSKDSLESHAKFRKKHKLKVALGSDPETEMAQAWGVWGEKTLYGRKYMGMERATFLVDAKGVIVQAWRKVKVPGHVEAVLEAAKSL